MPVWGPATRLSPNTTSPGASSGSVRRCRRARTVRPPSRGGPIAAGGHGCALGTSSRGRSSFSGPAARAPAARCVVSPPPASEGGRMAPHCESERIGGRAYGTALRVRAHLRTGLWHVLASPRVGARARGTSSRVLARRARGMAPRAHARDEPTRRPAPVQDPRGCFVQGAGPAPRRVLAPRYRFHTRSMQRCHGAPASWFHRTGRPREHRGTGPPLTHTHQEPPPC